MPPLNAAVRDPGFADFSSAEPELRQGHLHWLARAQTFWVEWVEFGQGAGFAAESAHELLLIAPAAGLHVTPANGAAVEVTGHSVAILPPGRYLVSGEKGAIAVLLASDRPDVQGRPVLNAGDYVVADPRIQPTGTPWRRLAAGGIEVLPISAIMASKDKPRLKMLQTGTMSINIVEYDGPRNRAELSPHSHSSFEQGSLAIAGDFVHHLRAPWGSDADQWRDDEHLQAPSPSLLVIPVEMIHTTEGVGGGHHFLVDIFSPPRTDFIGKGWVFNAKDYEAPRG